MKNSLKRLISLIMALLILVSAIPTNIFANGIDENSKELILAEKPIVIEPQINPEYEYYLQHKDEYIYGYIPPKYVLPIDNSSDSSYETRSLDIPKEYEKKYTTPAEFITSVKNQQQTSTCWAHAAISTIETLILKYGLADYDKLDLSEGHMVLNSGRGYDLESGGNNMIALQYLSSLDGPVSEKNFPDYTIEGAGIKNSNIPTMQDADKKQHEYYIPNTLILENNVENIKRCVFYYGSVAAGYYSDPKSRGQNKNYHYVNIDNNGKAETNHQVTIIGWNDDMEIKGSKGAFLVKNSWGTNSGDKGYFWISYASFTEGKRDPLVVFKDVERRIENLKTRYTYSNHEDESSSLKYDEQGKIAGINIFDRKEKGPEEISKVTFYNPNNYPVNYYLYITQDENSMEIQPESKNPFGDRDRFIEPSDNRSKWTNLSSGSFDSAGFFTINLDTPYKLEQDKFALRIELNNATMISLEETNPEHGKTFIFTRNTKNRNIYTEILDGNLQLDAITREVSTPSIEISEPEKPWETKEGYDLKKLKPLTLTVKNNGNVSLNNLVISLDQASQENFTLINNDNFHEKLEKDGEIKVQIRPNKVLEIGDKDKDFSGKLIVTSREISEPVTKEFTFTVKVDEKARAEKKAQDAADKAITALETKEGNVTDQEITDAQTLVDKVQDQTAKDNLNNRLKDVRDAKAKKEAAEKAAIDEATQLVKTAETDKTEETYNKAKEKVEALSESGSKTELQTRLVDVDKYIQADNAIKDLEAKKGNVTDDEIQTAQDKVNEVTNEANKQALNDKLNKVRAAKADKEAQDVADKAISALEGKNGNVTDQEIIDAEALINKVTDTNKKQEFEGRLETVKKAKADKEAAEKAAIEEATNLVVKAENEKTQETYNKAKEKVEALSESGAKTELQTRLAELDKYIQADNAIKDLEAKKGNVTDDEIQTAQDKVNEVTNEANKQALNDKLNKVRAAKADKEAQDVADKAISALEGKNGNVTETEIQEAQAKVDKVVNTEAKQSLTSRLDNVRQAKADREAAEAAAIEEAKELVKKAEELQTEEAYAAAKEKVEKLNDSGAKTELEARLVDVDKLIKADKALKTLEGKSISDVTKEQLDNAENLVNAVKDDWKPELTNRLTELRKKKADDDKRKELENYKNDAKAKIDALDKLNQEDKDAYKDRISPVENKEDVDPIVLEAQKDNAKKIIESFDKLTVEERTKAGNDIDGAADEAAIEAIVDEAQAKQNARQALEDRKKESKAKVEALDKLTEDEKEAFKNKIDEAETKEAVATIVLGAQKYNAKKKVEELTKLNEEEKSAALKTIEEATNEESLDKAIKTAEASNVSLDELKSQAKDKINNLDKLSEEEKAKILKKIDGATSKANVIDIITEAEKENNNKAPEETGREQYPWKPIYDFNPFWSIQFYSPTITASKPATETKTPVEIKMDSKLVIGSKTLVVTVDGVQKEVKMDVEPFISNNRTMLPIRFVAEALGLKVEWDDPARTVILTDKDTVVKIPVDTNKIIVNGVEYESDTDPILKSNRTMLPIANIARALGLVDGKDIIWDSKTQSVTIKVNK